MSAPLVPFEFKLEDVVGGVALTPATVDLPTLRTFLEEIEALAKGDESAASLADSRVQVGEGSIRVRLSLPERLAENANADFARLAASGDLDQISPRRAKVIERWQSRARHSATRSYGIAAPEPFAKPLTISKESQFVHRGEASWVEVEKYLVGKVVDLGGKQDPNVHLVVEGTGESLRIGASEAQLVAEETNQLYRQRTLRIRAEQHLQSRALRNLRLLQFLPVSEEPDEAALAELWRKGGAAWKGVPSAARWVEELRGTP